MAKTTAMMLLMSSYTKGDIMAKKVKKVKGFQMNKKTGHPSYAFEQKHDRVKSIGFTHNKKDIAQKVRLNYNIDPNDKSNCYAKVKVEIQKNNTYRNSGKLQGYRIHKEDFPIITEIIVSNKKRR